MKPVGTAAVALTLLVAVPFAARAGEAKAAATPAKTATSALPEDYSCMFCHGPSGNLAGADETKHLVISETDLAADIHWQKGIRCHDCHGGNPVLDNYVDHRKDTGFRPVTTPDQVPGFCGKCHSDTEYMRRYKPSPRTDQEQEYWTSGHGKRLRKAAEEFKKAMESAKPGEAAPTMADPQVATCLSCHSTKGKHDILAIDDQKSPVFPVNVAVSCSKCHADPKRMEGLTYEGRPLGHEQFDHWKKSVHGVALLVKGDLSAPTCNDCHGNHGALPPQVDSVANACGTCHGKVADLFAATRMKHRFQEAKLPGCATCHTSHEIQKPTDEMLGMEAGSVCVDCHTKNQYGATLAGAEAAKAMRSGLEMLKSGMAEAEAKIDQAEQKGMEVRGPRFDLRQARDALVSARTQVHSFSRPAFEKSLEQGVAVIEAVKAKAEDALNEHTRRRIWLAISLVPILITVGLLWAYIRVLPLPEASSKATSHH